MSIIIHAGITWCKTAWDKRWAPQKKWGLGAFQRDITPGLPPEQKIRRIPDVQKSLPHPKIIQNHEAYLTGSLGSLALTLGSTIQHGPVYSPWNGEDIGSTKHGWCCFKENKSGSGFGNSNFAHNKKFTMCLAASFSDSKQIRTNHLHKWEIHSHFFLKRSISKRKLWALEKNGGSGFDISQAQSSDQGLLTQEVHWLKYVERGNLMLGFSIIWQYLLVSSITHHTSCPSILVTCFAQACKKQRQQQQQQQQQTLLNLNTQDRSTPALWETKPLVHSAGSHDLRLQVIRKGAGTTSGKCNICLLVTICTKAILSLSFVITYSAEHMTCHPRSSWSHCGIGHLGSLRIFLRGFSARSGWPGRWALGASRDPGYRCKIDNWWL